MKFICPKCQAERPVVVVVCDCVASWRIEFESPGEVLYGEPVISNYVNSRYQCERCGWVIPIEPDAIGDVELIKWLSKQDYNVKNNN